MALWCVFLRRWWAQTVNVSANADGSILIQPVVRHDYNLAELLSRMTPENRHGEADFGQPDGVLPADHGNQGLSL